jgi:hypothetical protein
MNFFTRNLACSLAYSDYPSSIHVWDDFYEKTVSDIDVDVLWWVDRVRIKLLRCPYKSGRRRRRRRRRRRLLVDITLN